MSFINGLVAAWRLIVAPTGLLSDHQLSTLSSVRWRVKGGIKGDDKVCRRGCGSEGCGTAGAVHVEPVSDSKCTFISAQGEESPSAVARLGVKMTSPVTEFTRPLSAHREVPKCSVVGEAEDSGTANFMKIRRMERTPNCSEPPSPIDMQVVEDTQMRWTLGVGRDTAAVKQPQDARQLGAVSRRAIMLLGRMSSRGVTTNLRAQLLNGESEYRTWREENAACKSTAAALNLSNFVERIAAQKHKGSTRQLSVSLLKCTGYGAQMHIDCTIAAGHTFPGGGSGASEIAQRTSASRAHPRERAESERNQIEPRGKMWCARIEHSLRTETNARHEKVVAGKKQRSAGRPMIRSTRFFHAPTTLHSPTTLAQSTPPRA
ncbi:hypothetical protein FB451DRAFT_1165039 [Mycena latifolia]|nr:hypothetical protein FB451DRAFT_1165039 [Mycena latifolia]